MLSNIFLSSSFLHFYNFLSNNNWKTSNESECVRWGQFFLWVRKKQQCLFDQITRYPDLILLVQWFSILNMSSFWAFIAISLKFVCRTESVRQRKHWVVHKSGQKTPFLWPTYDSFIALTQCDKLVLRKWQKIPKKETWSKLKFTLPRKLDWGTFNP